MFILPFVLLGLGAFETPASPRDPDSDSLRLQAASLAKAGKLDAALALLESSQPIPSSMTQMLRGKLDLDGQATFKAYANAAVDSNSDSAVRGEALFRMGQFYYAAEKHYNAIPQFREYLRRYPSGAWANPAAYWMGYSCLQFVRQHPQKTAYLDTGLGYEKILESRNRPNGYYLSLALEIKSRLLMAKGDTGSVLSLLKEYRNHAPAEELPGALLLSAMASPTSDTSSPTDWWDSLRVLFPKSPEARLPGMVHSKPKPIPPTYEESVRPGGPSPRLTLQLGAFSQAANAEQLRLRLAAKGVNASKVEIISGGKKIYRVLYGDYPDAGSALAEGERNLRPLGYPFQVMPRP